MKHTMSDVERDALCLLGQLQRGELSQGEAAERLGCTVRQVRQPHGPQGPGRLEPYMNLTLVWQAHPLAEDPPVLGGLRRYLAESARGGAAAPRSKTGGVR